MLETLKKYFIRYFIKSVRYKITDERGNSTLLYSEQIEIDQYIKYKKNKSRKVAEYKKLYFKESSLHSLTETIEKRNRSIITNTVISFIISTIVFSYINLILFSDFWMLFLCFPILFIFFISTHTYFHKNSQFIFLKYYLNSTGKKFYQDLANKIRELHYSGGLWNINSIIPNKNPKNHGGAKVLYDRKNIRICRATPCFIYSNIDILCLKYNDSAWYFFPDFILSEKEDSVNTILYDEIFIQYIEKPYHETGQIPMDAVILEYRWLHPKKDGTPDRRFKRNRKIPITIYGEITISSLQDDHIILQLSNLNAAHIFSKFIGSFSSYYKEELFRKEKINTKASDSREKEKSTSTGAGTKQRQHKNNYNREKTGTENETTVITPKMEASEILGVPLTANQAEIKKAYRDLVKQYHPDRFANRDQSFLKEAEEKTKEINIAYENLKH